MPILYQSNGNIDKLNTFSWQISPDVFQMLLVLKRTSISLNWRHFRLRLFLIFEHNLNCSIFLYDITVTSQECHSFWTHRRFDWFITSLFSLTTKQYPSQRSAWRVDSLTRGSECGDLGCERVPISYAWVNRLIACAVNHMDDIWRKVVP